MHNMGSYQSLHRYEEYSNRDAIIPCIGLFYFYLSIFFLFFILGGNFQLSNRLEHFTTLSVKFYSTSFQSL